MWFDCYVAIDIFSRYIVGWMVASTENTELAEEFITRAVTDQAIEKGTLTIHADRGTSMTSKGVAELFSDLTIARTHSRPHALPPARTDNPLQGGEDKPASPSSIPCSSQRPVRWKLCASRALQQSRRPRGRTATPRPAQQPPLQLR